MSYWDKIRRKEANRKVTQEVINSPEFKEYMRQHEEQAVINALARFAFMMCEFLETRHGYKKQGMLKALKFVRGCLEYTTDNETFFKDGYEYFKSEYDLDVLAELGLGLEDKE